MPIHWDELRERDLDARSFDRRRALRRLASDGDPWQGMMRRARSLSRARALLDPLGEDAVAGGEDAVAGSRRNRNDPR
jgi:hypothetical protein